MWFLHNILKIHGISSWTSWTLGQWVTQPSTKTSCAGTKRTMVHRLPCHCSFLLAFNERITCCIKAPWTPWGPLLALPTIITWYQTVKAHFLATLRWRKAFLFHLIMLGFFCTAFNPGSFNHFMANCNPDCKLLDNGMMRVFNSQNRGDEFINRLWERLFLGEFRNIGNCWFRWDDINILLS